jgi:hypothetical protein
VGSLLMKTYWKWEIDWLASTKSFPSMIWVS